MSRLATFGDLFRRIERERRLSGPAIAALLSLRQPEVVPEEGLAHWAFEPLLPRAGARLTLTRPDPDGAAAAMVAELAEWRAASVPDVAVDEAPAPFTTQGPQLWTEYQREQIPPLFGAVFNPGNWNADIVRLDKALILLTTLNKGSLTTGSHYEDHFLTSDRMQWQSQTQTRRDSLVGQMLSGTSLDARVHLFVRSGKLRNGKAAPFLYCGQPRFAGWDGDRLITVTWTLPHSVPPHWWPSLGIRAE